MLSNICFHQTFQNQADEIGHIKGCDAISWAIPLDEWFSNKAHSMHQNTLLSAFFVPLLENIRQYRWIHHRWINLRDKSESLTHTQYKNVSCHSIDFICKYSLENVRAKKKGKFESLFLRRLLLLLMLLIHSTSIVESHIMNCNVKQSNFNFYWCCIEMCRTECSTNCRHFTLRIVISVLTVFFSSLLPSLQMLFAMPVVCSLGFNFSIYDEIPHEQSKFTWNSHSLYVIINSSDALRCTKFSIRDYNIVR